MLTLSARQRLQRLPSVTGVGVGYKEKDGAVTSQEAAVVFVEQKRPLHDVPPNERIAPRIDGQPTDVQEATFTAALLLQGDPIGPVNGGQVGTLGLILDRDRDAYALTNEHVVWADEQSVDNVVRIWQGQEIGRVSHILHPATGVGDAALVQLSLRGPSRRRGLTISARRAGGKRSLLPLEPEYGLGVRGQDELQVAGIGVVSLGDTCWSVGRTTGFTQGLVAVWQASLLVSFGTRGTFRFHDQTILRPTNTPPITLPGDSGKCWCRGDEVVSLCFAYDGTHRGTYSVATPIGTVFHHLLGPAWQGWLPY